MSILDLIFVPKCINCNAYIKRTLYLCDSCMKRWRVETSTIRSDGIYIAEYGKSKNTIARSLVLKIKDRNIKPLFEFLTKELVDVIKCKLPNYNRYIVTNVPRMVDTVREIGHDQAKLLAQMLAKNLNLKYVNMLINKGSQAQKLLNSKERQINADKTFTITNKFVNNLNGYKIILIDDVMTTGATLYKCKNILIENGAAEVVFVTLCKVINL